MKMIPALKMDSYRRRHLRRDIGAKSIKIAINGNEYDCLNWSPGGFMLRGVGVPGIAGEPVIGLLSFSGGDRIEFAATIVRVSEDQSEFGLRHADLELDECLRTSFSL